MNTNVIYEGNSLDLLKKIPDESIDCVVTSPPYYKLRDYGVDGQIGLENSFDLYIESLCNVFDEVRRVLKNTGSCWVNIGDTYSGSSNGNGDYRDSLQNFVNKNDYKKKYSGQRSGKTSLPNKSLILIPSRFAIEMCNRGWTLRNELIWQKPNCMPSSVKDRFTVDFEKVFFFVKNKKYFFNPQYEPYKEPLNRWGGKSLEKKKESLWDNATGQFSYRNRPLRPNILGRNKRSVWRVCTKPFNKAHFATFPEDLISPMISAGCPENGIVLDPFFGSGTTGIVALKQNKRYIGIELNSEYVKIANDRIYNYLSEKKAI